MPETDTLLYRYATASVLERQGGRDELFLSKYSEIEKDEAPCFFWGNLTEPYLAARCLVALSNVVRSSFNLSTFQLALLKDPIVTAGNGRLRFEGFSHCAGVYARVDILPGGYDGEFLASGTTNVDFNAPMISALSRVGKQEPVLLSVGQKEVGLHRREGKVVERKVPLPVKWIKGLATVPVYLSAMNEAARLSRVQTLQLFQSIPCGAVKADYYLQRRGSRVLFSPVKSDSAVCLGGVHRLRLLEPLLPFADELRVFAHPEMQATTWQLYFGPLRFSLTVSRDCWRGFSGEGAALESLAEEMPGGWLQRMDRYSYANQQFNPVSFAMEEGIAVGEADRLAVRLAAMGLLGYDLDENSFFYRRLPFKPERIMSLNPRLKNAGKLLDEGKVEIVSRHGNRVEARVEGSGVRHTVVVEDGRARCTCNWFSSHQGERGVCKHILAVRKYLAESQEL